VTVEAEGAFWADGSECSMVGDGAEQRGFKEQRESQYFCRVCVKTIALDKVVRGQILPDF
jgi:hypothetical protein